MRWKQGKSCRLSALLLTPMPTTPSWPVFKLIMQYLHSVYEATSTSPGATSTISLTVCCIWLFREIDMDLSETYFPVSPFIEGIPCMNFPSYSIFTIIIPSFSTILPILRPRASKPKAKRQVSCFWEKGDSERIFRTFELAEIFAVKILLKEAIPSLFLLRQRISTEPLPPTMKQLSYRELIFSMQYIYSVEA